ncbi:MAG: hypothetical protein ACJ76J_08970 [Thermoanaerobaculia bacterium]
MLRLTFQLNITGPEGPSSVALGDLAGVLARFERAVATYLKLEKVEIPEGSVAVSLLDIRQGSEGLVFSVPPPVMPVVALMSRNILHNSYASNDAHCEIYQLWEELHRHEWGLAFVHDSLHDIVPAEIPQGRGVPPPPKPSEVKGDTTILARCLRVGGVKPKAEIRLQTGELLYPDVAEAVAKDLGKYLYEEVVLKATATWRTDTWQVVDLQIDSISPFRRVDPVLAFKELADAAKGRWDEVDAKEYVDRLRSDANARDFR